MPLAFGYSVHRPRLLYLLAWTHRVTFLQQLGESRAGSFRDLILQLPRQIGEGYIRVDCLDVTQQLIGKPPRPAFQRRDRIEHGRKDDRLHDVVCGSRHGTLTELRWPRP
jgi:hypothetical protein